MSAQCTICSVQISDKKGIAKKPVSKIFLNSTGIRDDVHAGNWNRQVSLLAQESISRFEQKLQRTIEFGEFAENITTKGIELHTCKPLDRFVCNSVVLEITQIGKKCHGDNCAIFQEVGSCVMPKEGIFCKVISGGELQATDVLTYVPHTVRAKVITLSDRASKGEYEDKSGPLVAKRLTDYWKQNNRIGSVEYVCLPDDAELLRQEVVSAIENSFDFIITTGGTGIGPRDITPDVIHPLLEKEIPGIMEYVRVTYGKNKPQALLSRSIAGVSKNSILFTLPGSVSGVTEYMTEIEKILEHAFYMLKGIDIH